MTDLIPFILGEEKSTLLEEISAQNLSVIFDGTCRLGEVLAVILMRNGWFSTIKISCQ